MKLTDEERDKIGIKMFVMREGWVVAGILEKATERGDLFVRPAAMIGGSVDTDELPVLALSGPPGHGKFYAMPNGVDIFAENLILVIPCDKRRWMKIFEVGEEYKGDAR